MTIKTEAEIFNGVIATLTAGLAVRSIIGVTPQQWYSPRVVGAPAAGKMFMLMNNVTTHDYGFLGRHDKWDEVTETFTHTEVQPTEYHIQLTGYAKPLPAPAALPPMTPGDIAKLGARILRSDAGRQQLRALGFGIERITDVRQPYQKDESDQFTANPSFDFVLTFNQAETTLQPTVDEFALRIRGF